MTKQGLWQRLSPAISIKWMIHNLTEIVQTHRAETQRMDQKLEAIANRQISIYEQNATIINQNIELRDGQQKRTPIRKTAKNEEAA